MNQRSDDVDDIELLLWRWALYRPEESRAHLKAQIREEVINLRSLEREAVLRHFWGNQTTAEIAVLMDLGERSIKKLIEMGLLTIKRRLIETMGDSITA